MSERPMKRHLLISLTAGIAIGVLVTFLGYAELVAAHPDSFREWSLFTRFAIPLSAIGPDFPSVPQFLALWFGNCLIWVAAVGLLSIGVLKVIDRAES